jgi:hypothetical protein
LQYAGHYWPLKISGTEDEVLDAAVQHTVAAHPHENTLA